MSIYKNSSNKSNKGKVIYNKSILKGIVCLAVESVAGVFIEDKKRKKGSYDCIKINTENDGVSVDVAVDIMYGFSVPDVAFNIQQSIKHSVESMSKYKVSRVDVKVTGVREENKID